MNLFKVLLLLSMLLGLGFTASFKIQDVRLEIRKKSFNVSIPDEPGIEFVAFSVDFNRNSRFQSFIKGKKDLGFSDSHWVAEFFQKLRPDDIIYARIKVLSNHVFYDGRAGPFSYNSSDPSSRVATYMGYDDDDGNNNNNNGNSDNSNVPSTTSNTNHTQTQPITQIIPPTEAMKHCEPSVTKSLRRTVCSGELIFEDNFDTFNRSKWRREIRAPIDTGDAEFMLYDGDVEVKNGLLKIKPIQWSAYKPDIDVFNGHLHLGSRCTGRHNRYKECHLATGGQHILPPVVAPRINTCYKFSFIYGRVEIRAKLPKGDWLNPLLLLEPASEFYGETGYESGQLRVAYARGNEYLDHSNGKSIDGRILYGGAILFLEADRRDEFMAIARRNFHFGNDFHIYSLTWTPEHLLLEVDNQLYGQIPGNFSRASSNDDFVLNTWKRGDYMAPFDKMFYLTLGLSVGGFGDYPDNLRSGEYVKPWVNNDPKAKLNFWDHRNDWLSTWNNSELLVDYVRVYAL